MGNQIAAPPRSEPAEPATAPRSAWLSLAVVSLGLFLAVVSSTVVSVALPTIGRDLHAGATGLEWVVDAYVLVYASLLVAGGSLGDRHGRKGLFLLGVAIFALGSLAAGLAHTIGMLLAGRVIQGLGPALLVPGSLTIIRAVFTSHRQRAAAIGLWSTSSGVALAVGPPLGGVLVAGLGWRSVFLLNVPLAVVLLAIGARFLPRLPRTGRRGRFDWPAVPLTTAGVGLLALGVIEGQDRGWTSGWVLAAFAAGAAALAAFTAAELRRADPLVDVRLFGRVPFTVANVTTMVVFFAFIGAIVYFSAYFQQVQGRSPVAAGLDVAAVGVAWAMAAPLSGRLVPLIGERWPLVIGLAVSGAATLGLLRLQAATPLGSIWWDFALLGAGVGLSGTPGSSIAMSAVDSARAGMASAVNNASRQIGQVFGVAVLGALVYANLPGASGTGRRLSPAGQAAFLAGLHHALWVSGIALLAASLLAALLLGRRSERAAGPAHPAVR
ncbi:MAG: MFS transporter [Actinobacteria bacterium]|nr:MFS transporter [Actinomycetota bacterium]